LRTSQIFGLEWANVDLASGTALIRRVFVRGQQKDTTKTAVARTIIFDSKALAAIQRQRTHTQVGGGRCFIWYPYIPEFCERPFNWRAGRRSTTGFDQHSKWVSMTPQLHYHHL
jgi:hypothetical protein